MSGKKVISIRFHTDCKEDMELYTRMRQEAGISSSLAAVAKVRILDSYRKQDWGKEINDLQESLLSVIREEIRSTCVNQIKEIPMQMMTKGVNTLEEFLGDKNVLPEKSNSLPSGALDYLQ